jgi:HAMP domain-containing protein
MSVTSTAINKLQVASEQLRNLTLNAVFTQQLIDNDKKKSIHDIKKEISTVSDILGSSYVHDQSQVDALNAVVEDCISSIHEIHSSMKGDLISQQAEDEYGALSASINYLREQIERIKNN